MAPLYLSVLSLTLFLLSTTTTSSSSRTRTNSTATPPTKQPTSPSPTSPSTLDPKQLIALQSLHIPISKDPCTQTSFHKATACDSSKPFRHLTTLRLTNCSDDLDISTTALKSLTTLTSLSFLNCPTLSPLHLPAQLASNLRSFTAVNSLHKLTDVWLSHLQNLTEITVSGVSINAHGPSVILSPMKLLHSVTISHANLTGVLPKHWHLNLTNINFSGNNLTGKIPTSLTRLENLQFLNLSSNSLDGEIPTSIGDLASLQNLSLGKNSFSGPVPDSVSAMSELIHLDLGSNQLNGTVPKFISGMKGLKYLNLEKNNFHGVMPFNRSFTKSLIVFKIGGNDNLCYNHSSILPKVKLGIAPCDKYGMPLSPPPGKGSATAGGGGGGSSGDDDDYSIADDDANQKHKDHRGPSKVVLGVAIGLSSIVFLIIILVLLSKWCA